MTRRPTEGCGKIRRRLDTRVRPAHDEPGGYGRKAATHSVMPTQVGIQ
ncbi:hypothetical protein [Stappia albiluteola]|nr:hypothetical protein [Stappia albiluteola]